MASVSTSTLDPKTDKTSAAAELADMKAIRKELDKFRRAVVDISVPMKFDGERGHFSDFSAQFRAALSSVVGYNLVSLLNSEALVKPSEYPELCVGKHLMNFNIRAAISITNLLLNNVDKNTNAMLTSEAKSHPWTVQSISISKNNSSGKAEIDTELLKLNTSVIESLGFNINNILDPMCHPSVMWACLNKHFSASSASELESLIAQFHGLRMNGRDSKAFETFTRSINHHVSEINESERLMYQSKAVVGDSKQQSYHELISDQAKRRVLLHGLPDSNDRIHIEHDCPTYCAAVDALRALYRDRDVTAAMDNRSDSNGSEEIKSVGAVSNSRDNNNDAYGARDWSDSVCYTCGQPGHVYRNCPSAGRGWGRSRGRARGRWRGRGRGRGGYNSGHDYNPNVTCAYCDGPGHTAEYCRIKQRDLTADQRKQKWSESQKASVGSHNQPDQHHTYSVTCPQTNDNNASTSSRQNNNDHQSTDVKSNSNNNVHTVKCNDSNNTKDSGMARDHDDSDSHSCARAHTGAINNSGPQLECAILDTGSGFHLCNNKNWFKSRVPLQRRVKFNGINGDCAHPVVAFSRGTIVVPCIVDGKMKSFEIDDVYYVPASNDNLISFGRLARDKQHVWNLHYISTDTGSQLIVTRDGDRVIVADDVQQQYVINLSTSIASASNNVHAVTNESDWFDWHVRLGHPGPDVQQRVLSQQHITCVRPDKLPVCDVCEAGKSRKEWSQRFKSRATQHMERLHIDLSGKVSTRSINGAHYLGMVVDDYSRMHIPLFLSHKSDLASELTRVITLYENQKNTRVKFIRCDNGGENIALRDYCAARGIEMELTVPRHSVQNGVAERAIGDVFQRARCLMYGSGAPPSLWSYAIAHAADLHNSLPTKANGGVSPYELWSESKPDLTELKPFGCMAHVHISKRHNKLEPRCKQLIHIGRDAQRVSLSWTFWDPVAKTVISESDVTFDEKRYPWKEMKSRSTNMKCVCGRTPADPRYTNSNQDQNDFESCIQFDNDITVARDSSDSVMHKQQSVNMNHGGDSDSDSDSESENESELNDRAADPDPQPQRQDAEPRAQPQPQPLRYNLRENRNVPPIWYRDVQAGLYNHAVSSDHEDTKSGARDFDPDRPESRDEAMNSKSQSDWIQAERSELNTFHELSVYELVDIPADRKAIRTRWVYDTKRDDKNIIVRRKARLVACGYSQKPGIDFDITRAEVADRRTFRLVMAIANQTNMDLTQIDVTAAFLNSGLDEDIYVQQPPGHDDNTGRVWHLRKALYGLKQAAYAWERELSSTLIKIGFKCSEYDPCLFVLRDGKHTALLAAHVDDMLLATTDSSINKRVIDALKSHYKIKVEYQPHWFLKMRITRDRAAGTLKLDNEQYVNEILKRYNMDEVRPCSSPTPNGQYLNKELNEAVAGINSYTSQSHHNQSVDIGMYQAAVGSLNYLSSQTRPDIAFAVNQVSRYCHDPQSHHWDAVKHILRYLSSTRAHGITFTRKLALPVNGYSDASHAGDQSDRKSINGWVFRVGGAPISWSSKKQSTVALSSTEAEIISASEACREAYSIKHLLMEIDPEYSSIRPPITLFMDSRSAVDIAVNGGYRSKMKHLDVRSRFVEQAVREHIVKCVWIPTDSMIADVLTKPITGNLFKRLSSQLISS